MPQDSNTALEWITHLCQNWVCKEWIKAPFHEIQCRSQDLRAIQFELCFAFFSLFEIKTNQCIWIQTNVVFPNAGRYLVEIDRAHNPRALNEKFIPAPGPVSWRNIALQSESGGALWNVFGFCSSGSVPRKFLPFSSIKSISQKPKLSYRATIKSRI